jgi:RimJ/RimL family protein N-acetyltransferase
MDVERRAPEITPVEITAGRLHLRPWRTTDVEAVLRALKEERIAHWERVEEADPAVARAWVDRQHSPVDGTAAAFAVVDSTSGALLGSAGLYRVSGGRAQLSFWTLPEARGDGVATQAVGVLARWGFSALGIGEIGLYHPAGNPAACRVAEKSGFDREGTLREGRRRGDSGRDGEHLHIGRPFPPRATACP